MAPPICPNCGAQVPPAARACPECGADEETGWSAEAYAPQPDLPDEEFDYDKFVDREFGSAKPVPEGIHWFWWIVAIVLVLAFVSYWFGFR
jgi:hypothetical protein